MNGSQPPGSPGRRRGTRSPAAQSQALATRGPASPSADRGRPAKRPLADALAALASEHPTAHSARTEELGYLANVLIAGCTHAGSKLRPVEALEAALATCNLGLELWQRSQRASSGRSAAQLLQQVGCDRLFRAAWQALQRELVQPARSVLAERCMKLDAGAARRARQLVQDGAAFALRTVCDENELGLDEAAFDALLALAEELPWLARTHAGARPWLASHADFARCRKQLRSVAA